MECYREGTGSEGCTRGIPTDLLQWRAKAGDPLGADWSEKVVYTYWQDPTGVAKQSLQSEAYYSPAGLRRVIKYGADLQRRQVREAAGGPLSDPLTATLADRPSTWPWPSLGGRSRETEWPNRFARETSADV